MVRPDHGMYSIKLIHPDHLKCPYFTDDFDGGGGRWPLMNFTSDGNGPAVAARVPIGHRALVYVIHLQKFIWAIEYIGTLAQGQQAAKAHGGLDDQLPKWRELLLPIRFLAKVDVEAAPSAADIYVSTGIRFTPNQYTMKYISAAEYEAIFNAITWQWTAPCHDEVAVSRV